MTEIIVGTYDDFVIGYRVEIEKDFSLEQSFAVRAHSGVVRCLSNSEDGSKLLSTGSDEMINLFDLKKRKLLQTSEGAVNCAAFVGNSHLICGLEDGNIHVYEYKSSSMELMKTLKGHKLAVTSLSVHPTGKLLLSISKDSTMRTWNLIKGRCAYVTNCLKAQAHLVVWSKTGNDFIVAVNNEIYLYGISGSLLHNIKLNKRVNSIDFLSDDVFSAASDCGVIEFFDIKTSKSLMKLEAHESRVKSIKNLSIGTESTILFATASSDGCIKLWSVERDMTKRPKELASMDTGARLICMTTVIQDD